MKDQGKILFNQFLTDKNTYNLNVGYWRRKLQKALVQKIELAEQPIQNKNEAGKNFYDGNPIFSYYSEEKSKALRIVQVNPEELQEFPNMFLLDAWIDKREFDKSTNENKVDELVITILLTQSSVDRCIQTVVLWFNNKLNRTNLDAYIVAANDFNNRFFPLIDRFSPNHIGLQPIRVLQYNLEHQLENTNGDFLRMSRDLIARGLLQPGIKYVRSEDPINTEIEGHIQTPYVNAKGEIFIHETFLSYVWCMAYSLWTLYDEAVARPSQNLHAGREINDIDRLQIDTSVKLFKYGLSLYSFYSSSLDEGLPNPQQYHAQQSFYVEKSNGLYLQAMNFILCHEIAHIELGHTRQNRATMTNQRILNNERAADDRAIKWILAGETEEMKATIHTGVLIGLCSLLFLRRTAKGTTHPNTDDRINNLLTIIQPDEASPLWGIAALAFKLWDDQFQKFFSWSTHNLGSYKELYFFVKRQIEDDNKMS
ncbi:phage exclusion protein Lit family protein [Mucilaginibacter aquaedulcis]|uniref:phage exclusion protein Lit family protein n=1 Tax=Mucilaginibacter aquaedulcis TaxID=1187081 RepID=UPI0025B4A52E|nr:phage exclusion protein Lit family protein [Mucilaginibacter aquaedulcis]MDN3551000.1 phage exclusion protein Lit family protein [Mucilaginibacter aquaedulcis]